MIRGGERDETSPTLLLVEGRGNISEREKMSERNGGSGSERSQKFRQSFLRENNNSEKNSNNSRDDRGVETRANQTVRETIPKRERGFGGGFGDEFVSVRVVDFQ